MGGEPAGEAPDAVFASESVTEVLRHLQTEGRHAVPVVSENGHYLIGWATAASVLHAIGHRLAVRPLDRGGRTA
jgi:CBS-domain-containing membrane protein